MPEEAGQAQYAVRLINMNPIYADVAGTIVRPLQAEEGMCPRLIWTGGI